MKVIDAPISTDHKVVITTFRYRWKEKVKKKQQQQQEKKEAPDFSNLANDLDSRLNFGKDFRKALESIGGYDISGVSAQDGMERLKQATDTAAQNLPRKGPVPKAETVTAALVPAMILLEKEMEEWRNKKKGDAQQNVDEKEKLREKLRAIDKEGDKKLKEESGRLIEEHIKLLSKDPFHAWQRVFALEKKEAVKKAETITLSRMETHFSKLLRKGPAASEVMLPKERPWEKIDAPPPKFNMSPCDLTELRKCAWTQANHKAAGKDDIPAEILKCDEVLNLLVPLFNKSLCRLDPAAPLTKEDIPPQFFDAILVALFKKGDVEDTNNYRGISLMSYVAKLYHLFLMHRVRSALDPWLSPTQNAYRQSRGCQQHCVAAGLLHQHAKKFPGYELHLTFVDFAKAFDSVDRGAMRKILEWWTIPPALVTIMMTMLEQHKLYVRHGGDLSEDPITPLAGVLQGDTMAPYIFILCMDIILQQLEEEWGAVIENDIDVDENNVHIVHGTRRPAKRLTNLAYSDDVVLCSNSTKNAQLQFSRFEKVAASLGMKINLGTGKTEEIRINAPESDPPLVTAQGKSIGIVDNYKYLGTSLGKSWKEDFTRRKGLAWAIVRKYRQVWASKSPMDAKQKLFQALVEPALSYGAITYPDLAEVATTLHSTHSRMLRHCLGLPRADPSHEHHKETEWLYYGVSHKLKKTNRSAILTLPGAVLRQRLSALGHWVRDHYYRLQLGEGPLRRHPVIDVLRFDPSCSHQQRAQGNINTLRDAYLSAVQVATDGPSVSDLLKSEVLVATGSRCLDKHEWYNTSKARVREVDTSLLRGNMKRRLNDPKRTRFGEAEYKLATTRLDDRKVFTIRWLTRKTRKEPLGEDVDFVGGQHA